MKHHAKRPLHWMRHVCIISASLLPATCGGIDQFSVSQSSSATIPRGNIVEQLAGDIGFGGFVEFDITESEELQNQGVERHQIDSVRLTDLTLKVDAPAGGDLTFLSSIEFFVEAPGLPRVRIASGGPFPAGESRVSLVLDAVDLADYAAAQSMTITTEATGMRPDVDTNVTAEVDLLVDVSVSGLVCGG